MSLLAENSHISGIILAGGRSERFSGLTGVPKAAALLAGYPLLLTVAASLVKNGATRVIILSGDNHAEICAALGIAAPKVSCAALDIEWRDQSPTTTPLEIRQTAGNLGTGGRLLTLRREDFGDVALLAYADIVTDAPLGKLIDARATANVCMSILAVNPVSPWGELQIEGDKVVSFTEKALNQNRWINAGIFAVTYLVQKYIKGNEEMLERQPMDRLLNDQQVVATKHIGFWRGIDTAKDRRMAETDDEVNAINRRSWKKMTVRQRL